MSGRVDVIVGTIGRAHGLRGEVTVRPRTDNPELRFAPGVVLATQQPPTRGRALTVATHRWQGALLVVTFEKITDRSLAEALRGLDLWATVDPEEALDTDDFHDSQLIGLQVRTTEGRQVGRVVDVQHHTGQDLLIIRTDEGTRLVPFVAALVPLVDVAAGRLEVVDLPGLLTDLEDAELTEARDAE